MAVLSCFAPAFILVVFFFSPLVQAGFKAKIINAKNRPLEMSYEQVERYFNTFREIVSDHEVSIEAFTDYIALLARSKRSDGSAGPAPGLATGILEFDVQFKFEQIKQGTLFNPEGQMRNMTEHEQQAARSVIQLSPLTRSIAEKIVEKHVVKSLQRINRQRDLHQLKELKFIALSAAECDALVCDCANDLGKGAAAVGFEVGLASRLIPRLMPDPLPYLCQVPGQRCGDCADDTLLVALCAGYDS